ncbi:MAG: hypothetical protein H6714_02965 [Myxococcales bacterium]|nr:hypothetical protein [Myxococcales bacterium]
MAGKGFIAIFLAFMALASTVSAQKRRSYGGDNRSRAVVLFERSESLYREGKFSAAAVLLRQAYELEPEPVLLYNMGRALESDGQLKAAADAFQEYLNTTKLNASERRAMEARIHALKQQVDTNARIKKERDEAQRRQREAETRLLAERTRPVAPKEADSISPWPWVIVGIGAAGLAAGGVFGILAAGKHKDAQNEPTQAKALELQDSANTLSSASVVMLVTGGIITVGGLTWGLVDIYTQDGDADTPADGTKIALRIMPSSVCLLGTF